MALQRLPLRADVATVQTVGDDIERGHLQALSQRKLNALGLPVGTVAAAAASSTTSSAKAIAWSIVVAPA